MPDQSKCFLDDILDSFSLKACLINRARALGVELNESAFENRLQDSHPIDYIGLKEDAKEFNLDLTIKEYSRPLAIPKISESNYFILNDDTCIVVSSVTDNKVSVANIIDGKNREISAGILLEKWAGKTIAVNRRKNNIPNSTKNLFSLYDIFKRHRRLVSEAVVGALFFQLMALAAPVVLQIIFDKVIIYQGYSTLNVLAAVLVVIMIFQCILHLVSNYIFGYVSLRINSDLKMHIITQILGLRASYFDKTPAGKTLTRVKELDAVIELFAGPQALNLFSSIFFMFAFIIAMFYYSVHLTLIVIVLMTVYLVASLTINKKLNKRLKNRYDRVSKLDACSVEIITGAGTIKANTAEHYHKASYAKYLVEYSSAWMQSHRLSTIAMNFTIIINDFMGILVIYLGSLMVMDGHMSLGGLVAFYLFLGRITGPLMIATDFWQRLQKARVSLEKASTLDEGHKGSYGDYDSIENLSSVDSICFDNVSFMYSHNVGNVINNISFSIQAGEFVALAGLSGSGKSTVAKLIQGLYSVTEGSVNINGIDIKRIDQSKVRQAIGVVDQDIFLFNDSIYQNIISGDISISISDVVSVCKKVGAHDFINSLPEKYNTQIGQSGVSLSGGEKQRIAIARALVRNPQILIMDEPSSAMDYHTENVLIQHLPEICDGRIVILIAHRLTTIRKADKIIIMDKGEIIEQGMHEELMGSDGYYSAAYNLQIG